MEEILHHLLSMKPYEKWDLLHISWLAGFLNHQQYVLFCEFKVGRVARWAPYYPTIFLQVIPHNSPFFFFIGVITYNPSYPCIFRHSYKGLFNSFDSFDAKVHIAEAVVLFCACITVGSSCWCFRNPARKPTWEVHKTVVNNGDKLPLPQLVILAINSPNIPRLGLTEGDLWKFFPFLCWMKCLTSEVVGRYPNTRYPRDVGSACFFGLADEKKEREATAMNFVFFFWQIWEDHELSNP